jgi:hypothetical protein
MHTCSELLHGAELMTVLLPNAPFPLSFQACTQQIAISLVPDLF